MVVGAKPDEVLAAFGGDPSEPTVPGEDLYDSEQPGVLVVERPGCALVVEFNGFEGSRPEVLLTRASAAERNQRTLPRCSVRRRSVGSPHEVYFHV